LRQSSQAADKLLLIGCWHACGHERQQTEVYSVYSAGSSVDARGDCIPVPNASLGTQWRVTTDGLDCHVITSLPSPLNHLSALTAPCLLHIPTRQLVSAELERTWTVAGVKTYKSLGLNTGRQKSW